MTSLDLDRFYRSVLSDQCVHLYAATDLQGAAQCSVLRVTRVTTWRMTSVDSWARAGEGPKNSVRRERSKAPAILVRIGVGGLCTG
jgi:hypothetical protein